MKDLELSREPISKQEKAAIRMRIREGDDPVEVTQTFGLLDGELHEILKERI